MTRVAWLSLMQCACMRKLSDSKPGSEQICDTERNVAKCSFFKHRNTLISRLDWYSKFECTTDYYGGQSSTVVWSNVWKVMVSSAITWHSSVDALKIRRQNIRKGSALYLRGEIDYSRPILSELFIIFWIGASCVKQSILPCKSRRHLCFIACQLTPLYIYRKE